MGNSLLDYSIEKQSKKNVRLWEDNIFKFSYVLAISVIFIEFLFYFFFKMAGVQDKSFNEYAMLYIVRPFVIDFIACVIATILYKKAKGLFKNVLPLCLVVTLCSTLLIVHYHFPCLYPLHTVPIFVSTIYGNRKLERIVLGISFVEFMFAIFYISKTSMGDIPDNFAFYIIISIFILSLVHTLAQKIIIYQNENLKIIKNAILYSDSLKESVLHDGLTKVHNHTAFTIYLDKLMEENVDNLCLSIIDIDYFKKVNDTYGHEVGNVVLQKLAEILSENLNDENMFLARYGGEEFVILFKNISFDEAFSFIEGKRVSVSNYFFEEMDNKNITFSAGLTSYKNYDVGDFINKADKLLYEAKNNGRNRIYKER